ncbi:MAG: hypothetical protein KDA93_07090 [Planctomycetaceae bacterium]|nr:hypothetical protein [Planctomycetaceae bacterium]
MSRNAKLFVVLGILLAGCSDSGGGGTAGVNPYDNAPAPVQEVPAAPPRPMTGAQTERMRGQNKQPAAPPQPSLRVNDAGEHAIALTFAEYANMTRKATEMTEELTKIHIAVDESGDAGSYQDRWGELTADLTQLYTRVLATGYPPEDVAQQLNDKALPQLKAALSSTELAMKEHAFVESGIDRSFADAKAIYEHMSHNLTASE